MANGEAQMADEDAQEFVPFGLASLAAARSAGGAAPLSVVSKEEASSAFTAFQVTSGAHRHGAGGAVTGEPRVSLQREGERVTGIRVECACGQVIELACSY